MVPAPISISQLPEEHIPSSPEDLPENGLQVESLLPPAYLTLFFCGHVHFFNTTLSLSTKSARYRALILSCRETLSSDVSETQQDSIVALSDALKVWHLLEAMYLSDTSDTHISLFVSEWYRVNYEEPTSEIKSITPYTSEDELWPLLTKLAIVGEFAAIRQLLLARIQQNDSLTADWADATGAAQLGRPPTHSSQLYSHVEAILARAPGFHIAARADGSWNEWQRNCTLWATSDELQDHPAAARLLALLGGNTEDIAKACSNWQEMLVACSIYAHFNTSHGGHLRGSPFLIEQACAHASAAFDTPANVAGGALLEAAMGHADNAIVHMGACLPSSWFSAHLCDLLVRGGKMTDALSVDLASEDTSIGMREYYIRDFARGLECYRGMWRIAADYFMQCPSQGQSLLVDMLLRVPFDSHADPTAEKVLLVCKKRKLRKTARDICERLGTDCLQQDNLGGAMSWYARAGLSKRAESVAVQALRRAEVEGPGSRAARSLFCVVRAVINFGDEKMREQFQYMRVYSEMQSYLVDISKFAENVDDVPLVMKFVAAVRRLLGGGGLPRSFWCIVAYEAAKVLEIHPSTASCFPRTAINEILGALQLVSGPHRSIELISGLRRRLAFDANATQPSNTSDLGIASIEEAESAMGHCRSIFVRNAAKKINSE